MRFRRFHCGYMWEEMRNCRDDEIGLRDYISEIFRAIAMLGRSGEVSNELQPVPEIRFFDN